MSRRIAFLRAINVGGRVVKMADLRGLFEGWGFSDVETVIQSGNVVFDSGGMAADDLERFIEQRLETALGYRVAAFLRSPDELSAVLRKHPFGESEPGPGSALYVAFLQREPTAAVREALRALGNEVDELRVTSRELYWLRRKHLGESAISSALLERTLKGEATVRNMTTVARIVGKYC